MLDRVLRFLYLLEGFWHVWTGELLDRIQMIYLMKGTFPL